MGTLAEKPRRLRRTPAIRRLVAETRLDVADLVAPLFVHQSIESPQPISSLSNQVHHTVASVVGQVGRLRDSGVTAVLLFGVTDPGARDEVGSGASDGTGIVQVALRALRDAVGDDVVVMADLCLDEYTSHGHCGVLGQDGSIDAEATLVRYGEVALAQAEAGAQVVAPSGMMDGQVQAIRQSLDEGGYGEVAILSYAAKYASALYGPFRHAVDVDIADGGDRRGYQQNPANARESRREIALDVAEGADMIMIKPALTSLDVIAEAASAIDIPVAAYQVSGEYAMIHAASERGWIDGPAVAREQLLAIRRAGADFIVSYFASDVAELDSLFS